MGLLSPPDHTTEISPRPATTVRSPLLKREMPGLDILRGVAVLSVVMYHGLHWWLPPAVKVSPGVIRLSSLMAGGWLGVNLFFVLSGFLITGILIDTRTRANYWRSFYVRRILRIFPLYVVTLLILHFYAHFTTLYAVLCLLYLANFTLAMNINSYGPLWSLAVEEQFYLVWPFLVRRLRLRTLAILCAISILLSPLLRYLTVSRILPLGDAYTATWLVSDNIAAGALIAIFLRTRVATLLRIKALTLAATLLGAALLSIGLRFGMMGRATAAGAAFQTEPFLLLFLALLLLALQYGDNPVVFLLSGPLRFFGYISYGLYLLHLLVFQLDQDLFTDFQHGIVYLTLTRVLVRFFGVLGVSTLICYLSRRYFEEYFLRYKDRLVPYTAASED